MPHCFNSREAFCVWAAVNCGAHAKCVHTALCYGYYPSLMGYNSYDTTLMVDETRPARFGES